MQQINTSRLRAVFLCASLVFACALVFACDANVRPDTPDTAQKAVLLANAHLAGLYRSLGESVTAGRITPDDAQGVQDRLDEAGRYLDEAEVMLRIGQDVAGQDRLSQATSILVIIESMLGGGQ